MVIYDRLGSLITKTLLADLFLEVNVNRVVFNINTGNFQIVNKVHKIQDGVIWRASATEMNNHADTHYFEANSRPILLTLEECTGVCTSFVVWK